MIVTHALCLVLFFQRKRIFTSLFLFALGLNCLGGIVMASVLHFNPVAWSRLDVKIPVIAGAVFGVVLFTLYLLKSRRVKATFVR